MAAITAAAFLVSAYLLVRRRLGLRPDESLLTACLLVCLEVVVVLQALGAAGWLKPFPGRAATAAFLGIHLALAYARPAVPAAGGRRAFPRWLLPAAVVAALTLAIRIGLAAVAPPDGWDGLGYHLPFVVRWIRQGNLDLAGWTGYHRYFAWNGELLSAWLALLDGGSLASAKLVQVMTLPILAASGSSLGRRLAGTDWAAPCALGLVAIPIVIIQSGIAYVDALYAAFWIAAIAAAVAWARTGRPIHLTAWAAAAGLAWGTKSTLYFLAPLLVVPAVAIAGSAARRWTALRIGAPAVAAALAAGAGSYVRNFILTGNPIFPFGLSLGGWKVFPALVTAADMPAAYEKWFVSSPWGWILYPFKETVRGFWGYTHLNGFGPLFALGWLGFAAAVWTAWRRRDAILGAFLALFPISLLLFFTLQPVRIPRYVIFLAPLPILGLAAALRGARGAARTAARVVWSLAIVAGCGGTLAYLAKQPGYQYAGDRLRAGRGIEAWDYYQVQFGSLGQAWRAVDAAIKPGDKVAVNYGELVLPWAGLQPRADVRVVVFGRSPYPDVACGRTPDEWLAAVERFGARLLVVWSPAWAPDTGGREREAVLSRPDHYEPVGRFASRDFGWVEIYRVRP